MYTLRCGYALHFSVKVVDGGNGGIELKLNAKFGGQRKKRIGDADHAALGVVGALVHLKVRNHAEHGGSFVGIAAIVSGVTVKKLHGLGRAKGFCIEAVERCGEIRKSSVDQRFNKGFAAIGFYLVQRVV